MYALPVRATDSFEIVDANGVVLVPSIVYKGDIAHRVKQKQILLELEEAMNNRNGYYMVQVGLVRKFVKDHPINDLPGPVREKAAEVVEIVNGRRGNPAFQKGKSNPYAKKGGVNA